MFDFIRISIALATLINTNECELLFDEKFRVNFNPELWPADIGTGKKCSSMYK